MKGKHYSTYLDSPIGRILLKATDKGLSEIKLVEDSTDEYWILENNHVAQAREELQSYYAGELRDFTITLDMQDAPPFHQAVWKALCDIPYGQVSSYKKIANQLNRPKGSQAVGQANAKNPIAIIVPCHRVVGSDGSLTGYAWGMDRKKWLLEHERNNSPKPPHLLF